MFSAAKTRKATTGGYSVSKSLRFRSSASAYLNRTPASASNRTTWTWSAWLKRGSIGTGAEQWLFGAENTTIDILLFDTSDRLQVTIASSTVQLTTTQVFRDPSAWYHFVWAMDTTQATAANRMKLYVNGAQITSFSTASYPAQNYQTWVDLNVLHEIGRRNNGTAYFDGYMAEVNFIDGQALTPSSFGAYDTNGVWQPAKYSGTYGTNGFYLPFSNTTSTTTLGYDTSGNGNNWTTNNISLTAGTTYDSMTDSPTVTSASVANYAVLNPLGITSSSSTGTANGNLQYASTGNSTGQQTRLATMGFTTGKWYYEWIETANTSGDAMGGWANNSFNLYSGNPDGDSNCWGFQFVPSGPLVRKKNGATATTIFSAAADGDVMMVAVDLGAGKIWIGKNGVWSESGVPSTGTNAQFTNLTGNIYYPYVRGAGGSGATSTLNVNYGQQPFTYTPPTGFNALNTYNLPSSNVPNGAAYMAATLYTGTGNANGDTLAVLNSANNTIGTTFQPDFVWAKLRSGSGASSTNLQNILADSLRGTSNLLNSDSTAAEYSGGGITAFNSNGFTAQRNTTYNQNNVNGWSYVGWQWKASGSTVSNTSGTITSTVSANTTAGFSVVTYTGNGSTGTVGHGLGAVPSMIIVKSRSSAATPWECYHISLGQGTRIRLNDTAAATTDTSVWNNTSPTSSVFSIGNQGNVNTNAATQVAYCWAAVPGFSAFGSYTGNGSTDGPFCYTGFRPRWIMFKRSDSTGAWNIFDTSRDTYNVESAELSANSSAAEGSVVTLDGLSNGFKIRNSSASDTNANGGTYVYAAFAETPFQSSRAR